MNAANPFDGASDKLGMSDEIEVPHFLEVG